jgi:hypothetical protein
VVGVGRILVDLVEVDKQLRIWPEGGEDLEQAGKEAFSGVDGAEIAGAVVPPAVETAVGGPLPP